MRIPFPKLGGRHLVWGGVGAAVLAVTVWIILPDPVPVDLGAVDRGPLEVLVEEDGETRVEDRYVISAPVTGRMVRLECEVGDPMEAGQELARIFPLPLDTRAGSEAAGRLGAAEASLRSARAGLAGAEAVRDEARRSRERLEAVAAEVEGAVSQERLDAARTAESTASLEVDRARGVVEAATFEVNAARAALAGAGDAEGEPVLVRAPAAGRVLRLYEECERVIAAGSPIMELGDPSRLEVVAEVLSEDAARLREGARSRVTWGDGADTVTAVIRLIEPSAFTRVSPLGVEEQRVNVRLAVELGDRVLGDRYAVDVIMVVWASEDVVRVPVSALFRVDGGWGVFTVEDERARVREIELGHRGRREAEVLGGITEGETVILYPSSELEDGMRIRAAEG